MALLSRAARVASRFFVPRRFTHDSFGALNILKDPSNAPVEKADEEYPEWLWNLLDTQPTKEELLREAEKLYSEGGYDAVLDNMEDHKICRLFKLHARDRIKDSNAMRAAGSIF